MFDYLQKYNQIPKEIRDKVSSPQVMSIVNGLENKYGIELSAIIIKIMIKEIDVKKLDIFFIEEHGLDRETADKLSSELKNRVLGGVKNYLGIEEKIESKQAPKFGVQNIGREEDLEKREDFLFTPEDEEEIKKLSEKIEKFSKFSLTDQDYEEKINKIISKTNVRFGSGFLLERFKSILKTYLKGIRDKIETKQALIKPIEDGGTAFDNELAGKVLITAQEVLIDKNITAPQAPPKIKIQEDFQEGKKEEEKKEKEPAKDISVRDLAYDLTQLKKPVRKEEFKKERTNFQESRKKILPQDILELNLGHELAPPPPSVEPERDITKKEEGIIKDKKENIKISKPEKREKPRETIKIDQEKKEEKPKAGEPAEPKKPSVKYRKPSEVNGKKRMDDVKHIPRVMTPVDELRYMNLINFRRLGDTPEKAVNKIQEKIDLLEEEKYSKRVEGIRAWRQSPINKLYLKLGQLSINERKPVGEIINRIKNKGEDYLTKEEFDAVMDLNKKIRY